MLVMHLQSVWSVCLRLQLWKGIGTSIGLDWSYMCHNEWRCLVIREFNDKLNFVVVLAIGVWFEGLNLYCFFKGYFGPTSSRMCLISLPFYIGACFIYRPFLTTNGFIALLICFIFFHLVCFVVVPNLSLWLYPGTDEDWSCLINDSAHAGLWKMGPLL